MTMTMMGVLLPRLIGAATAASAADAPGALQPQSAAVAAVFAHGIGQ